MDIEDSSIYEEIKEIQESGPKPVYHRYVVEINTEDDSIEPYQTTLLDVERDYAHNYGDVIVLTVKLSKNDFIHRLYPHRENFTVTLTREPVGEIDGDDDYDFDTTTRTYQGVLLDGATADLESARIQDTHEKEMEKEPPEEYRIQLIDLAVERLRVKTTGGIYREMRTDDVIRGALSSAASDLDLDEDEDIAGVDVVDGDNENEREHVIIPHGTPVMELARFIQDHAGGVYNTGIGTYIQGGTWFVYPRFHARRFDEVDDNLTILNIPEGRLPAIERTYLLDGDGQLIVLATDETVETDVSEKIQYNLGTGLRYINADRYLKDFHETQDNISTVEKDDNVKEYTIHQRQADRVMAMFSPERITSNDYVQNARLAEARGSYVRVRWENADPALLYPGQPVRFVWMEQDGVNERFGCLLGADFVSAPQSAGGKVSRFATVVDMTVFLEKDD